MPILEYGTTSGLAYRHNFQQDIQNLHYNEQLDKQAQDRASARVKEMADMMQVGSTFGSYNVSQLKDFTQKKIAQLIRLITVPWRRK